MTAVGQRAAPALQRATARTRGPVPAAAAPALHTPGSDLRLARREGLERDRIGEALGGGLLFTGGNRRFLDRRFGDALVRFRSLTSPAAGPATARAERPPLASCSASDAGSATPSTGTSIVDGVAEVRWRECRSLALARSSGAPAASSRAPRPRSACARSPRARPRQTVVRVRLRAPLERTGSLGRRLLRLRNLPRPHRRRPAVEGRTFPYCACVAPVLYPQRLSPAAKGGRAGPALLGNPK